jgi:pseudouridine-5'-phosphate glycosidase
LHLQTAILICVPVPEADELPVEVAEAVIKQAIQEAEAKGISGKALTPFLLARTVALSEGKAQRANEALLVNNARVAARIARAMS